MIRQLIILFYILIGALTPSISIALVIGSDQEEIYIDANFSGEELLVSGRFILIPLSQEIVKVIYLSKLLAL